VNGTRPGYFQLQLLELSKVVERRIGLGLDARKLGKVVDLMRSPGKGYSHRSSPIILRNLIVLVLIGRALFRNTGCTKREGESITSSSYSRSNLVKRSKNSERSRMLERRGREVYPEAAETTVEPVPRHILARSNLVQGT